MVVAVMMLVFASIMLGPAFTKVDSIDIPWTLPERGYEIPRDFLFNPEHAFDHRGQELDAEKVYKLLLEGKCAVSSRWCGKDKYGSKEMYLCDDPVSGLIGVLIVYLEGSRTMKGRPAIYTGYGTTPEKIHKLRNKVWIEEDAGEQFGPCD